MYGVTLEGIDDISSFCYIGDKKKSQIWPIGNQIWKVYNIKTLCTYEIIDKLFYVHIKKLTVILLQFRTILLLYKPLGYWDHK